MSEYTKWLRIWGLVLAGIGLIGIVVKLGFWGALSLVLVLWGNNLEQTAKTVDYLETGKL